MAESRVHWEHLEEWVRQQIQRLIQELLEEEVTEFPGRSRCARRLPLDSGVGYRNGYGKPRKLTLWGPGRWRYAGREFTMWRSGSRVGYSPSLSVRVARCET